MTVLRLASSRLGRCFIGASACTCLFFLLAVALRGDGAGLTAGQPTAGTRAARIAALAAELHTRPVPGQRWSSTSSGASTVARYLC